MSTLSVFGPNVLRAVRRARWPILTVAGAYALSVLVGIIMVHAGSAFALSYRDRLVSTAHQQDPAAQAASRGSSLEAALRDFASNLVVGAIPKTVGGLAIIMPYPLVAYQGWVGGIVSVRGDHTSRFNDPRSTAYYLLTLVLQLIPYSLATGVGIQAGIASLRPSGIYQGPKWLGLVPREALKDIGRVYALVIPLFLIASLWEFLSPWNV